MNPTTLLLIDNDPAYCLKLQAEGINYGPILNKYLINSL